MVYNGASMPIMTIPAPAMWHADIDYTRFTIRRAADEGMESALGSAFERIAGESISGPYTWEPFAAMGYRGYRLGSCAYGYRDDQGYLCQGSSLGARPLFDLRLPVSNYSRLDVQITFWYESDRPIIAKAAAAGSSYARAGARGRPWSVRYISGYGDGDTCYIGTRGKKSKFIRIYDKWREADRSEHYRYAWRMEAELTDVHARNAAGHLLDTGVSRETVAALVSGLLAERGITVPPLEGVRAYPPDRLPADDGNIRRRLLWLETQVAPAVDKLMALGVSSTWIQDALGLRTTKEE